MKAIFVLLLLIGLISATKKGVPTPIKSGLDKPIFIEVNKQFKSIRDLLALEYFKNKTVYIDLWATTCAPCIREFPASNALIKKYEGKDVAFLYICYNFNLPESKERVRLQWKELIEKNKLSGFHAYTYVMPPDSIIHEPITFEFMQQKSGKAIAYGVPTHFIAKNGKILVEYAPIPSDPATTRLIDSVLALQ
jgi:thiol-disulfide isomerase/thioredoxin